MTVTTVVCSARTSTTHCAPPPPSSPDAWHAPPLARCPHHRMPPGFGSPCVLSPDPVTTPGRPVPGGCVRGGRQTALPRRAAGCVPQHHLAVARRPRSARTRTAPCPATAQDDLPPAPAHVPAAPAHQPARPAPRGRRADTRTSVATQARTGRRATWTAQSDYLLDLPTTRTPCQRHRRAA